MKNLYRISQSVNNDYDTYSDAVVCAESEDAARRIHPSGYTGGDWWIQKEGEYYADSWASKLEEVKVELIGIAVESVELNSIIISSFHAG